MPAVRIKDQWREQHLFDQRSFTCAAIIALATAALIVRLFVLQVARHEYYAGLSQGNRVRNEPIPAARGLILDRHGEVIAGNQPAYQLELVPEEVPDLSGTPTRAVQLGPSRAGGLGEPRRTRPPTPIPAPRSHPAPPARRARSPASRSSPADRCRAARG